jgi:hypothetical protein
MKSFEQFKAEKTDLNEFFDPATIGSVALLGTLFLRSTLWDKAINKAEGILNHFERNHFFNKCLNKMRKLPKEPTLDDVKHALGPDFDRFKAEYTDQVIKVS